ncbi:hypothetical protein ACGYLO_11035 [Sulfitobacter sp. 1A13353]|uniref:hypothetical protein n=1 Tax=Sulfitobacter sp. 1A13353 TaxID=3368568 RepID=UPI003746769B
MSKAPETDRVTVKLPFSGLYNTIHDQMMDIALEQINTDDEGAEQQEICSSNVRWAEVHLAYVQAYTQKAAGISDLDMSFQKIISPRDYAMGNDEIIVTYPLRDLEEAFASMDNARKEEWRDRVEAELTERPGFVPFSKYPKDADDWGPVSEWDDAQRDLFFDFHAAPLIGDEADIANDLSDLIDDRIWRAVIDTSQVPGHVDNYSPIAGV